MKLFITIVTILLLLIAPQAWADSHQANGRHHVQKPPVSKPVTPKKPVKPAPVKPTPVKPITPVIPPISPVLGNATVGLVTYYGYPDNSPPGTAIQYPDIHSGAGGTGTYADPLTFATSPKEYAPGTILYVPYISKYVVMEDSCAECISDWSNGKSHIDIWMVSNANFKQQVLACEDKYTKNNVAVITNPPSTEVVNTIPMFDTSTGVCS